MVKNLLLLFAAIAGFGFSTTAQTTLSDSFMIDGMYRSYQLYIPATITQDARPLVINMHGLGSNATEQQYYGYFMPIADTAGFYVVMPQGTSYNGTAFWNVGVPGTPNVNDVKFISALIDTLATRYPVDRNRVYATGMSNGGYMSHLLGIELNNKIAAIASVAGTIVPEKFATAMPGRSVPVMEIHGDADGTVPYEGYAYGMPIDSVIRFWIRNNGCNATPVQTPVPDVNTTDGCTAGHLVWNGGRNGATVELYRIYGGGHTWPGASFNIGVTNQDFNASAEIWRFFRQYRLEQFTAVKSLPANEDLSIQLSPNPAAKMLHVAASLTGVSSISDIAGKVLMRSAAKDIDVSGLPSGMYLLQYTNAVQSGIMRFTKRVIGD